MIILNDIKVVTEALVTNKADFAGRPNIPSGKFNRTCPQVSQNRTFPQVGEDRMFPQVGQDRTFPLGGQDRISTLVGKDRTFPQLGKNRILLFSQIGQIRFHLNETINSQIQLN